MFLQLTGLLMMTGYPQGRPLSILAERWAFLAVLEFSLAGPKLSAEISAQHQPEAHQVRGHDHD